MGYNFRVRIVKDGVIVHVLVFFVKRGITLSIEEPYINQSVLVICITYKVS